MPTFGLQVWGRYLYAKGRVEILLICAVAIKKGSKVAGHVSRKMLAACSLFSRLVKALHCEITDNHHQYSSDLPQGGLEIPCKFVFQCEANKNLMSKMLKLVQSVPPIDLKHVESSMSASILKFMNPGGGNH